MSNFLHRVSVSDGWLLSGGILARPRARRCATWLSCSLMALALGACQSGKVEVQKKIAPAKPVASAGKENVFGASGTAGAKPEKKTLPAPSDVAAPPADAGKTASGLAFKILTPGTGKEHPGKRDRVTVHYTGWTTDGKMFDSSVTRNRSSSFGVSG